MDSQPESKLPELKTTSRTLFTDAVLVAAIPAGIFLFAYCYEFGYAYKFAIPWQPVSVTWGDALRACFPIVVVICLWVMINQLGILFGGGSNRLNRIALYLGIPVLIFVAIFILSPGHRLEFLLFMLVNSAILAFLRLYLWPTFVHREEGQTYQQRLRATVPLAFSVDRHPWTFVGAYFLVGILVFFSFGQFSASRQKDFYVLSTPSESVLLADYADTFVFEHFDRKTKKLEGGIIVMKLADGSPLTLEREKVGPLSPPKAQ